MLAFSPIALCLELTCVLTTVFMGIPQWVTPKALSPFFTWLWVEMAFALCISGWLTLSLIGITKTGFLRYLSNCFIYSFIVPGRVFLFGYLLFSWLYLDQISGLDGLIHLFWQRYQEACVMALFVQTECISLIIIIVGFIAVLFERLRPSRKTLGKAHFKWF